VHFLDFACEDMSWNTSSIRRRQNHALIITTSFRLDSSRKKSDHDLQNQQSTEDVGIS